jgi:streptogramin lyase
VETPLTHSCGGCPVIRPSVLICSLVVLACLLFVVPALAATVECPSTCTCLLPEKAKDMGLASYCGGKETICGYDGKSPMYCYEKPVPTTVPELKILVTTTTPIPVKPCPASCKCLTLAEAKATGFSTYCGDQRTVCGYDASGTLRYCFEIPVEVTTTTTAAPSCPATCICTRETDAAAKGLVVCDGTKTICGYDKDQTPLYCFGKPATTTVTTTVPAAICTPPQCKPGQVVTCAGDCPGGCGAICEYTNLTPTIRDLSPQGEARVTYQEEIPSKPGGTTLNPVQKREPREGVLGILDAIVIFFGSLFGKSVAPPSPELHHTMVNCNGVVTDVETDPNNCGSCGVVCETGACANSTCISRASIACAPHHQNCDGTCRDLRFDRNNCGACGNVCPADRECCGGSCLSECPAYVFDLQWGGSTEFFYWPYSIAVDGDGYVYVADTYNHRIQKFTSDGSFITQWGTSGTYGREPGQFYYPTGVAVDESGNIYVADRNNERIQKFTSSGAYSTYWGSPGREPGQFYQPCGVDVDDSGNVYVADTYNHRIQKFDSTGYYLGQWGTTRTPGSGNGQFNYPYGIAVDGSGNVYVADTDNHRIQKFTSTGVYLTQWGTTGTPGSGNGQFNLPHGVEVDGSGDVYVADTYNHRIQKFDSNGTYIAQWGSSPGPGEGQFALPCDVAADRRGGYFYVADSVNNRIQRFRLVMDAAGTSTWRTRLVTAPDNSD